MQAPYRDVDIETRCRPSIPPRILGVSLVTVFHITASLEDTLVCSRDPTAPSLNDLQLSSTAGDA